LTPVCARFDFSAALYPLNRSRASGGPAVVLFGCSVFAAAPAAGRCAMGLGARGRSQKEEKRAAGHTVEFASFPERPATAKRIIPQKEKPGRATGSLSGEGADRRRGRTRDDRLCAACHATAG
jgi:hypothetical protein